jgi:hypothetical protein
VCRYTRTQVIYIVFTQSPFPSIAFHTHLRTGSSLDAGYHIGLDNFSTVPALLLASAYCTKRTLKAHLIGPPGPGFGVYSVANIVSQTVGKGARTAGRSPALGHTRAEARPRPRPQFKWPAPDSRSERNGNTAALGYRLGHICNSC